MGARWDGDERGRGVANARELAPGARELVAAMEADEWVAEEPEAHLLPHLERACADLPLELVSSRTDDDGTFAVELKWQGNGSFGAVRQAVFTLAGAVAEGATYLRQRREGDALTFELVTGMLGDAEFAPHGHAVRFLVRS